MMPLRLLAAASLTALLAVALVPGPSAWAQARAQLAPQEERIAAVVNEDPITTSDVLGRLRLAIVSSGLQDTAETRQRLLPQVVRILVDERLQLQEARRYEISASESEINRELVSIANRFNLSLPEFEVALTQSGVPIATMRRQVEANIAWVKLVQRRLRPVAYVPDEEVDRYMERLKANTGKPEYLVSEIFIAVDRPEVDGEARQLADRLVEQIAQGANFSLVAQQFSQSAGAASGGDLGWIQQGQLEVDLDTAIQQLTPGQFSRPIRGLGGYHIMWLRDLRTVAAGDPADIQLSLRQVVLPTPAGISQEQAFQQATQISQTVRGCDSLDRLVAGIPDAQYRDQPLMRVGDIPAELGQYVRNLPVGAASQPLVTDVGIMLLMVCDRVVPEGSTPPRDEILTNLTLEKLDMLQRRLLRDLRRDATVETRAVDAVF